MDIIDAFIVSIGLDPTEYERGADDVARINAALKDKTVKDANEVEKVQSKAGTEYKKRQRESVEGNKKVSDSFNAVKRETLGMLAVLIGANSLKDFVAKSVTGFTTMQQAAQQAGLSVQDLAAFGSMIEANGGQADSARASISALAATLEAARTGLQPLSGPMLMGMNQIGAGLEDDPLQIFQKYAAWAEGKDPRLAAQTGRALGFDQASIDLAIKGSAAVADAFAKARENLPTPADVEKVRDLQIAFSELATDMKGFATNILTDVAPTLALLFRGLDWVIKKLERFHELVDDAPELGFFKGGTHNRLFPNSGAPKSPPIAGAQPPSSFVGRDVASRAAQAKRYFIAQGYTPAQASGMVATLMNESGPDLSNLHGSMYRGERAAGVAQWRGNRKRRLLRGRNIENVPFEEQLAFIVSELRTTEAAANARIRSAQTPAQAAAAMASFERPANVGTAHWNNYVSRAARNAVTVGQINIHTPSTNPREHAREVQRHLNTNPHVAGANSGVPN